MVHPLNQGEIWDGCNAETVGLTMAAPAPNKRIPVVIPVGRGTCDGILARFRPAFKATPFQGQ